MDITARGYVEDDADPGGEPATRPHGGIPRAHVADTAGVMRSASKAASGSGPAQSIVGSPKADCTILLKLRRSDPGRPR